MRETIYECMTIEEHDEETKRLVSDLVSRGYGATLYRECGGNWEGDGASVPLAGGACLIVSWIPEADDGGCHDLVVWAHDKMGDEVPLAEGEMRNFEFFAWLPKFVEGWAELETEG